MCVCVRLSYSLRSLLALGGLIFGLTRLTLNIKMSVVPQSHCEKSTRPCKSSWWPYSSSTSERWSDSRGKTRSSERRCYSRIKRRPLSRRGRWASLLVTTWRQNRIFFFGISERQNIIWILWNFAKAKHNLYYVKRCCKCKTVFVIFILFVLNIGLFVTFAVKYNVCFPLLWLFSWL